MSERLKALAALSPRLDEGSLLAGQWHGMQKLPDGSSTFPWFEHGPGITEFITAAGPCMEHGFDWPTWNQTPEAERLFTEPDAIEAASEDDLVHMVTTMVRQERFVDGALASHFEQGTILRICARAAALVTQAP